MRRTSTGSRWLAPRQRYNGSWRQNPWINAVFSASQARSETDGSSAASVAAGRERVDEGIQDRQHKAAVRTWENEGGSLGTQRSIRG